MVVTATIVKYKDASFMFTIYAIAITCIWAWRICLRCITSLLNCHVYFRKNSYTVFSNNITEYGGAVSSNDNSRMSSKKIPTQYLVITLLIMMEELYSLMVMAIHFLKMILTQCL